MRLFFHATFRRVGSAGSTDYLVVTSDSSLAYDRDFTKAAGKVAGVNHVAASKVYSSNSSGNIIILFDNSYSWYRPKELK